jgi:hypothetical protein
MSIACGMRHCRGSASMECAQLAPFDNQLHIPPGGCT